MEQTLVVSNLCKTFLSGLWPFQKTKEHPIVKNISFVVNKGEIVGLLGSNGAGKTTTIQMLLGTITPTSGSIQYFGCQFLQDRVNILQKVGYASGYDKLPGNLTVMENLDIVGRLYGMASNDRMAKIESMLQFFNLYHIRNNITGTLSAGQGTCIMLIKAFMHDPEFVLLDEPTASLDVHIAQKIREFILQQAKERKCSILITSHNMQEVMQLCDRVLVLKKGVIIANDTPSTLVASMIKHVQNPTLEDYFVYIAQESE